MKRIILSIIALAVLFDARIVFAQLSGTYTIGTTGDYNNFTKAVDDLISLGVSNAVVFNVSSGTYSEQVYIPQITGASAINTITFQSAAGDSTKVILSDNAFGSQTSTVYVDGADFITFKQITIQQLKNTYNTVHIENGATNNTITNCIIKLSGTVSNVIYSGLVDVNPDSSNVFRNNVIQGGLTGISWSNSTNYERGIIVDGNQFINQYYFGIEMIHMANPVISNNIITNQVSANSDYRAITFDDINGQFIISGNNIILKCGNTLVRTKSIVSTIAAPSLIANNFVSYNGNFAVKVIRISTTDNVHVLNNSINITGLSTSSRAIFTGDGTNNVIKNNIVSNKAGGYAIDIQNPSAISYCDYNDLYTTGTYIGFFGSSVTTLNNWKIISGWDTHSVSVDPSFVSDTDLHSCSPFVDGRGIPTLYVTTDIDGEPRNVTTPDIGADEFTSVSNVDIGNDTVLCAGDVIILHAPEGYTSYLWSDGSTADSLIVDSSGIVLGVPVKYTVTVTEGNCYVIDSVHITFRPFALNVDLGADTAICRGESITLDAGVCADCSYIWKKLSLPDTLSVSSTLVVDSAGSYYVIAEKPCGVIDKDTITITVNPTYITNDTINLCEGDSTYLEAAYQITSGIYVDTLSAVNTCDSVIITVLNVNPVYHISHSASICNGDSILLANEYQYANGIYTDSLTTAKGCDSIIVTTLTVNDTIINHITTHICQGDSVFAEGLYQIASGTYYDTLTAVFGCDSIVITSLTVNSPYTTYDTVTICNGDSVLLQGMYQTVSDNYYDTLTTVNGCDSIIATTLTVNPTYHIPQLITICNGDSVLLQGMYQTTSDDYYDTLSTINGCDSVIATTLTVNSIYLNTQLISICDGDSVLLQGMYQTMSDNYYDTLPTINGCDSIIETELTVNNLPVVIITPGDSTICEGDSILLTVGADGTNQWYRNGVAISGAAGDTCYVSLPGVYNMIKTDTNGCSDSAAVGTKITVDVCTGVKNCMNELNFNLFPNPSDGIINIQVTDINNMYYNIQVINPSGQTIYHNLFKNSAVERIDLTNYPKGVYVIKIINSNAIKVSKVIIY